MNARTDEQFCHDKNFLVAQMTKFYYPWCSAVLAQERAPLSVLVFSPVFCDVSVVVVVVFFFHIAFIAACDLIACSLERRSGNIEH